MKLARKSAVLLCVMVFSSAAAVAQQVQVREMLMARGAPADFADQVAEIVSSAESEALPVDPLVSKALATTTRLTTRFRSAISMTFCRD